MKNVAIIVPIYKGALTADEDISLRQLRRFLSEYKTYYIAPQGLAPSNPLFPVVYFNKEYFTSLSAYSQLLMSREFYSAFSAYDYILIYQTDALVFSGQLDEWCEKGYDYIGAPWLAGALPKNDPRGDAVGNGGFSLRKVSSCLKTIESFNWPRSVLGGLADAAAAFATPWKYSSVKQWLNAVRWKFSLVPVFGHVIVEDYFWSFEAARHNPGFRKAPVEEALQFAFENSPRYCFERNGNRLPFGCHAWAKYDRQFWEQYLLE